MLATKRVVRDVNRNTPQQVPFPSCIGNVVHGNGIKGPLQLISWEDPMPLKFQGHAFLI